MSGVVATINTVYHLDNNPADERKPIQEFIPEDIFVTSWTRKLAEICIDLTLCFLISLVGVVTNILVIMVFVKQKFKDSVAVSMTAIAIWDFIKCLGCCLQRLSGPISLWDAAAGESWANISVVALSYLICFVTYVSIVLAAYVAVERCLCVTIPFKVKWLITPRNSFIICSIISVVVFGWFAVMYGIYDIVWVYSFHFNQTIAIYVHSNFYHQHKQPLFLFYNLSGIILPVICFVVIVASTFVIMYQLRKSSNFRSGSAQTQCHQPEKQSRNNISVRERQVVKMLLVIIVVYVISLSPRIAHYTIKYFVYEFYFLRRYHNIFMIATYILYTFDVINAAINLFIFLAMSSAFRATFQELFPFCYSSAPVKIGHAIVGKTSQTISEKSQS
ncbi:hypothetical protein BsWGS_21889 [Bradybaena similaris]